MTIQCHNLFFIIVCFVSTDADVCTDRRGCLHRPTRMSASTDANYVHATFTSAHQALCPP
jgi:hypothetical protein